MSFHRTDWIATYAAVVATAVFAWDIVKWKRSGPQIDCAVQTGMQTINVPEFDGMTLISARVTNTGDRTTTITNMGLIYYASVWEQIRKRPSQAFLMANPSTTQPLPFELKTGSVWIGMGKQDEMVEELARSGRLYCYVYFSHSPKGSGSRIRLKAAEQ